MFIRCAPQDIFVAGYKFWEYKNRIIPCELAEVPLICLERKTPAPAGIWISS